METRKEALWIQGRAWWRAGTGWAPGAIGVKGERICAITSAPPPGANILDLGELYILPGLIDTHVHLYPNEIRDPGLAGKKALERARSMLMAGVTTVRDVGGPWHVLAVTKQWNRYRGLAPWVLASGPPLTVAGGHGSTIGIAVDGCASACAAVEQLASEGADLIKVMATAGGGEGGAAVFSEGDLRAVVETAHRCGLPVAAHAHAQEGIRRCIRAGVDTIEHASFKEGDQYFFCEDVVAAMAQRRIAAVLTPVQYRRAERAGRAPRLRELEKYWRSFYEHGVMLAVGTDVGVREMDFATSTAYALEVLGRAGLDPTAVLTIAGPNSARAIGLGYEIGRISPGYRADLIALPSDPLQDLGACREVPWVMARGVVVKGYGQGMAAGELTEAAAPEPAIRGDGERASHPLLKEAGNEGDEFP